MKRMLNNTHIEGILYNHKLELKVTKENSKNPGTEYISGTIEIATDNDYVNIIPIHFTYVTAKTAKGKVNDTYTVLKNIISKVYKTAMEFGVENATMLRVDSAIDLNEFYTDRNGEETFVSAKRNEGGFVHVTSSLDEKENARNTFDCDIVITSFRRVEADEEKGLSEKGIIKGAIFNFRKELLPVEFSVLHPNAIDYFEDRGASTINPVFTRVKGEQISESIVRTVAEESAFGGPPSVKEFKNTRKDFVVTWAAKEPYDWDDEDTILASELKEAMANREIKLAEKKQERENYLAAQGTTAPAAAAPASKGFNF